MVTIAIICDLHPSEDSISSIYVKDAVKLQWWRLSDGK